MTTGQPSEPDKPLSHPGPTLRHELSEIPAWLRKTAGEPRLPVFVVIVVAITLQALLPTRYLVGPRPLIPALEAVLLVALTGANPVRLSRETTVLRVGSLALTALISVTNAVSAGLLVHDLVVVKGAADNATSLLTNGAAIYLTNIIAFALWYWEFDRGGPFARRHARRHHPDFLFPQMANPEISHADWHPLFLDYLYVSFTNAVAFSPTDTMPLSRWAKMLMAAQSAVALITLGLVIARAVNVLK